MYPWSSILIEKRAFRELCNRVFWACLFGAVCGYAAAFFWTEGGIDRGVLLVVSTIAAVMSVALSQHVFQRPLMAQAPPDVVAAIEKMGEELEDYGDKLVSESLHFLIEYCGGVRCYQAEHLLEECRRKRREYMRYKLKRGPRQNDTESI